ncbi:MAG: fenitrothion hydrolase [Actinomycetota bacterium]
MRRGAVPAAAVGAWLIVGPAPAALAHGLGGRVDLPVPRWLFVFGAATALVVSFVALSALWTEPRFEGRARRRATANFIQAMLTNRVLEWVVRFVSLAMFCVVVYASTLRAASTETIGPVIVFVWFWVGLAIVHSLFGNWWATLSPLDTLGRLMLLDYSESWPPRAYPKAWGTWPAAILLFGFVWIELVDPFRDRPGTLGLLILLYAVVTVAGMSVFGRKSWVENGEAFAVYLGLLAAMAPFARDERGRVVLRPPLSGLAEIAPRPGLLALVMIALGSTTFDGVSRTSWWTDLTGTLDGLARLLAGTAGLIGVILAVTLAYTIAMMAAGVLTGDHWHVVAVRFAHSLVPIVFAYVVAHYFSFLVLEGQIGLANLSDPFGYGWDLFGTGRWTVNLALLSATLIWYVQVAAIVAGHVGGVVSAHDRAIGAYGTRVGLKTQYALLGVMVVFTATGLLILSGG